MDLKEWIKIVVKPSEEDVKIVDMIKKIFETHEVRITERGTIYIKRNENNDRKN